MNATVAAAIVGCLSAILTSVLAGLLSHRKLRAELAAGHRRDLILRQIAAIEQLWSALRPISLYGGATSVMRRHGGTAAVCVPATNEFCEVITVLFFSPTGLYLSRDVRKSLFDLRDFLSRCVRHADIDAKQVQLPADQLKQFNRLRNHLFTAIRAEIGAKDLRVGREGPTGEAPAEQ